MRVASGDAANKAAIARAFWAAATVIYIGGVAFYYAGVRPRPGTISREIIPVDEPTMLDWVELAGMLFLT